MQLQQGVFISLEGADGSGKSTNAKFLQQVLEAYGYTVLMTREPGGTPLGEAIRALVLGREMATLTELLLFAAARAEHIARVIQPALARGDIVISDRFSDSTYAYQGAGRGEIATVRQLEELVQRGFQPDHTLFFDVTLEESERRLSQRSGAPDRFDAAERDFKQRVWSGYQRRLHRHPDRMVRIDAMQDMLAVQAQIRKWVDKTFA